jgi:oligopeptidase B
VLSSHGDDRVDDWHWLRERDNPDVIGLLEAENAWTEERTAHLEPLREAIYDSILARTQLTDVSYPAPKGAWSYYVRTVDGLEHGISCRRPTGSPLPVAGAAADEHETVLLDENELAKSHPYFEVGDTALSPDQRLLAYAADVTGGELMTVKVRDLTTGDDLPDVIEGAYYGLEFAADNETLFYTRPDDAMRPYQVWRHRLGTGSDADSLVAEEADERYHLTVGSTKDGRYLVLQSESNVTSESRLIPAGEPTAEPALVEGRREGVKYSIEHHDGQLLVLSNDGAENFQLFTAPVGTPGRDHWSVLLSHRDDVRLEALDVVAGFALVEERGHATTAIRLLPLTDGADQSGSVLIEAPEAGAVFLGANLDFHTDEMRYEATTLITPRRLYSYDLATGESTLLRQQPVPGYDSSDYRTERRFAKSADGTEVPITLAWRSDRPEGPGPCLLYGYGAYEASMDPTLRIDRPIHPLLDRGVVYAIAHVRGGGELGRRWYLDGKLEHKHHSFEDFVASARSLVASGVTTAGQLAATGGSAGGLLMGASVNLAPDELACVVAEVPFVDCLTTMLDPSLPLTATEWEEWGDPISSEAAYRWIKAYSPYDNVRAERYPEMLVTGGLNDPRVGYFEPTKWVQKLRAAHPDNRDRVLLRVEMSAGHSGPSGRYQSWKKRSLVLAFVLDAIGAG